MKGSPSTTTSKYSVNVFSDEKDGNYNLPTYPHPTLAQGWINFFLGARFFGRAILLARPIGQAKNG